MKGQDIFDELFVLEMANNHWGSVERGLKIISDFSKIVRFNNVKATIKLQIRDVDSFIHKSRQMRLRCVEVEDFRHGLSLAKSCQYGQAAPIVATAPLESALW